MEAAEISGAGDKLGQSKLVGKFYRRRINRTTSGWSILDEQKYEYLYLLEIRRYSILAVHFKNYPELDMKVSCIYLAGLPGGMLDDNPQPNDYIENEFSLLYENWPTQPVTQTIKDAAEKEYQIYKLTEIIEK